MTRDVLSSVGLPVLVALLTTLAVEYLAKPRLDARKERITSSRRQVDNVVHGFQLAGMLIGSLLNVPETRDERWRSYVDDRLRRLDESLTTLELDISLLSIRYVVKHSSHVGKTAAFIGYFEGVVLRAAKVPDPDLSEILQVAERMDDFDTYFRVYLGLGDSQEPALKRLFWRRTERAKYSSKATATLQDLGLRVTEEAGHAD